MLCCLISTTLFAGARASIAAASSFGITGVLSWVIQTHIIWWISIYTYIVIIVEQLKPNNNIVSIVFSKIMDDDEWFPHKLKSFPYESFILSMRVNESDEDHTKWSMPTSFWFVWHLIISLFYRNKICDAPCPNDAYRTVGPKGLRYNLHSLGRKQIHINWTHTYLHRNWFVEV